MDKEKESQKDKPLGAIELIDQLEEETLVFLSCKEIPTTFQSRILKKTGYKLTLLNTIPFNFIKQFIASKSFLIQTGPLKMHSYEVTTDGKDLIYTIHNSEVSADGRQYMRSPPSKSLGFYCEILNPVDGITILQKRILEMHHHGLSMATAFNSQLFVPKMRFHSIKIFKNSVFFKETGGEVTYKRKLIDEDGENLHQVGFKFIEN